MSLIRPKDAKWSTDIAMMVGGFDPACPGDNCGDWPPRATIRRTSKFLNCQRGLSVSICDSNLIQTERRIDAMAMRHFSLFGHFSGSLWSEP